MKRLADLAAVLVAALAMFHSWGVTVLLLHLSRGQPVEMPVFGLYSAHDVPQDALLKQSAFVMAVLLGITLVLWHLANGLRQRQPRAWALSVLACATYAGLRLEMARQKVSIELGIQALIGGFVLAMVVLLLATPAFLKIGAGTVDKAE